MSDTNTPVRYEVRFIPITGAGLIAKVVTFVEHALAAGGYGAVVASDKGIQITAPVDLLHNLVATVNTFVAMSANAPAVAGMTLYEPLVFPGHLQDLRPAVRALDLCPPDMRFDWFTLGDFGGVLVFSGPVAREGDYNNFKAKLVQLVPPLRANRAYSPGVEFPKGSEANVPRLIEALAICPPDMRLGIATLAESVLILISGPSERQSAYTQDVLPSLRVLVGILEGNA